MKQLRTDFEWLFTGNVLYSACQWAIVLALAKLGSPAQVGEYALGMAVSGTIILFANFQLRALVVSDLKRQVPFNPYSTFRLLPLGLAFVVFGCNGFFHFLPMPPPKNPVVVQYVTALATTGYMAVVFALQIIGGLLLLVGFVPLGLVILCPIIVNIVLFHACMAPDGLPLASVFSLLAVFLIWRYWGSFAGLMRANA